MKKLILFTGSLLVLFSISACKTGPETPPPDDNKESSDEYDINLENAMMELDTVE